ncbi:MAG: hypothetical protein QOJ16_1077 [Acidobacteriota bacterium]|jgi:hypothetical protein|nr:hypothetical protein [Acidobacteriota bacterium]
MMKKRARLGAAPAAAKTVRRAVVVLILCAALAAGGLSRLAAAEAGFVRGDFYATSTTATSIAHYDATGALLDPLSPDLPRGTQLHGLAQGPDVLLYVVADAGPATSPKGYFVLGLDARGEVVRRYEAHESMPSFAGAIVFDPAGNFYVTTDEGFARFRRAEGSAPTAFRLSGPSFAEVNPLAATLLPNGDLLLATTDHLYEVRPDGIFVREIRSSLPLHLLQGLAYDAAGSAIYATLSGDRDTFNQLLKLDLATGRLLRQVSALYGTDVVLVPDGRVVLGSSGVGPQVFSRDLRPLGAFPGDPENHITQIRTGLRRSGGRQP